jgi:hypothetical protein
VPGVEVRRQLACLHQMADSRGERLLESLRGTLSRVAQRGHDRRLRLEGQAGETAPPAGTTAVRPGTPALACTRN